MAKKVLVGPLNRGQVLFGCGLEGTGWWSSQGLYLRHFRVQPLANNWNKVKNFNWQGMRQWRNTQAWHVDLVYKRLHNNFTRKSGPNIWCCNSSNFVTSVYLIPWSRKDTVPLIHFRDGETQAQWCSSYTATLAKPWSSNSNPTWSSVKFFIMTHSHPTIPSTLP